MWCQKQRRDKWSTHDNTGMPLVHHVMAEPRPVAGDSAGEEPFVDPGQKVRDFDAEEPVQRADGRSSKRRMSKGSCCSDVPLVNMTYRSAGSLPKKTTKTKRLTASTMPAASLKETMSAIATLALRTYFGPWSLCRALAAGWCALQVLPGQLLASLHVCWAVSEGHSAGQCHCQRPCRRALPPVKPAAPRDGARQVSRVKLATDHDVRARPFRSRHLKKSMWPSLGDVNGAAPSRTCV